MLTHFQKNARFEQTVIINGESVDNTASNHYVIKSNLDQFKDSEISVSNTKNGATFQITSDNLAYIVKFAEINKGAILTDCFIYNNRGMLVLIPVSDTEATQLMLSNQHAEPITPKVGHRYYLESMHRYGSDFDYLGEMFLASGEIFKSDKSFKSKIYSERHKYFSASRNYHVFLTHTKAEGTNVHLFPSDDPQEFDKGFTLTVDFGITTPTYTDYDENLRIVTAHLIQSHIHRFYKKPTNILLRSLVAGPVVKPAGSFPKETKKSLKAAYKRSLTEYQFDMLHG